jgi:carboxypeptidase C (cathepsin A)
MPLAFIQKLFSHGDTNLTTGGAEGNMRGLLVKCVGAALVATVLFSGPVRAEDPITPPVEVVTLHTTGGAETRLTYEATAGTLPILNEKNEITAHIFYTAYTRSPKDPLRPVTFVFNGGPGAAAAYLHLGALGPRVVNFTANGSQPVKPLRLADNPDNWLDFTDLVFVDPVGTGYSRAASADEQAVRAFYSAEKDAANMVDVVRLYLARSGRSLAPLFFVGESYGGFRAVLVSRALLRDGYPVHGAILVSPALDFTMLHNSNSLPLAHALRVPSIAATHAELTKGSGASLDFLPEVETFVRTDYLLHMVAGLKRDDAITATLARYTGLSAEVINRNHSRVSVALFRQEYERHEGRAMSLYDATVTVPSPKPADLGTFDPILDGIGNVMSPAMTHYAAIELNYHTDLPYLLLNRTVNSQWDFGVGRFGFPDVMSQLEEARTQNPEFRVLIVHGYTDLVTPYDASRFLVSQLRPIEGAVPVELRVYRGGHMMYMRSASRQQLATDARALYRKALQKENK